MKVNFFWIIFFTITAIIEIGLHLYYDGDVVFLLLAAASVLMIVGNTLLLQRKRKIAKLRAAHEKMVGA